MGWITERHMQEGGTIGRPPKKGEWEGIPLKKIISTLRASTGMFDPAYVELECGHTTYSNAMKRARCRKCKI